MVLQSTVLSGLKKVICILRPDLSTWLIFPWEAEHGKVARLICSVYTADGEPFLGDPRNNLKKMVREMQDKGFKDFNIGPEPEFFLFKLDEIGKPTLKLNDQGGYFDFALLIWAKTVVGILFWNLKRWALKLKPVIMKSHLANMKLISSMPMQSMQPIIFKPQISR